MFHDFWENNKEVIQFVGIICGVGALFLAIPSPTDAAAKNALANMQFIWLIFIAISTIFLFMKLYYYFYNKEREVFKKYGFRFELQGSASYILMGFTMTFALSLWEYASAIYPQPLKLFSGTILGVSIFLSASVAFYFIRKLKNKLQDIIYAIVDSSILSLFYVSAFTVVNAISYNRPTSIEDYTYSVVLLFLLAMLLRVINIRRRRKKEVSNTANPPDLNPELNSAPDTI